MAFKDYSSKRTSLAVNSTNSFGAGTIPTTPNTRTDELEFSSSSVEVVEQSNAGQAHPYDRDDAPVTISVPQENALKLTTPMRANYTDISPLQYLLLAQGCGYVSRSDGTVTVWNNPVEYNIGTLSGANARVAIFPTEEGVWWPMLISTTTTLAAQLPGTVGDNCTYSGTINTIGADTDMEADGYDDWTNYRSAILSKESGARTGGSGSQYLRVTYGGEPHPAARQEDQFVSGNVYRATGWARGDGGTAYPRLHDGSSIMWSGTTSTDWQYFDVVFTPTNTQLRLYALRAEGAGEYCDWDDVTITPIAMSVNLFGDGDFEGLTTDNFAAGNSAVLSKESGVRTGGSGSQVLRITYGGVAYPYASQTEVTTSDNTYRITGWARGDGSRAPMVWRSPSDFVWTGTSSTDWQYFDVCFTAEGEDIRLYGDNSGTTGYVEFDDISIRVIKAQSALTVYPIQRTDADGAYTLRYSVVTDIEDSDGDYSRWQSDTAWGTGIDTIVIEPNTTSKISMSYAAAEVERSSTSTYPTSDMDDYEQPVRWGGVHTDGTHLLQCVIAPSGTYPIALMTRMSSYNDLDMENPDPTAHWVAGASAVLSKEANTRTGSTGSRCMRITYGGVVYPYAYQPIIVPNRTYRITGWARGDGSRAPTSNFGWSGTSSTDWQYFDVEASLTNYIRLYGDNSGTTGYVEFDDIQVGPVADRRVDLIKAEINLDLGHTSIPGFGDDAINGVQGFCTKDSKPTLTLTTLVDEAFKDDIENTTYEDKYIHIIQGSNNKMIPVFGFFAPKCYQITDPVFEKAGDYWIMKTTWQMTPTSLAGVSPSSSETSRFNAPWYLACDLPWDGVF